MATQTESQIDIADRLIAALQRDEFVLYVQTIIPLQSPGKGTPFQEVYIRFKEEDEKLLPPGSFFHLLEESRLLPSLDRWVVSRLARWIRNSLAVKPDWLIPRNNVNLSAATLADATFGEYVRLNVDESYLSRGALGLEISWNSIAEHRHSLDRLMAELRPHGITFTVAEFDGSESSFAILEELAPDFVKLNQPYVYGFHGAPSSGDQVSAISRRCDLLNIKTIMEGVENRDTLAHLRQTPVDFAQGFAISAVVPL
jgi:EAL domain-containing protein (putative c-di-GMP-specific phosphodiesterase class I)